MLELQKFMTALAMPVGTSLALGLTAFGAAALGRHRLAAVTGASGHIRPSHAARDVCLSGFPFEVIPASTDVEIVPQPSYAMRWMPGAGALEGASRAIHEVLGLARCRFVGC